MWVRKTEEEISREEHTAKWGLTTPLLVASFFTAGTLLLMGFQDVRNLSVGLGTAFFLGLFVVFYLFQMVFGSRRRRFPMRFGAGPLQSQTSGNYKICSRCFDVKDFDQETACACGGIFERFEDWKWVKD